LTKCNIYFLAKYQLLHLISLSAEAAGNCSLGRLLCLCHMAPLFPRFPAFRCHNHQERCRRIIEEQGAGPKTQGQRATERKGAENFVLFLRIFYFVGNVSKAKATSSPSALSTPALRFHLLCAKLTLLFDSCHTADQRPWVPHFSPTPTPLPSPSPSRS